MNALTVTIEIPKGARTKYEVDHETGRLFLDRVLFTAMGYPADYGYIDDTLGEDGDPLDALVLLPTPIYPGIAIRVRPVAMFMMTDEHGPDAKILTVLDTDPRWAHIQDLDDVPISVRNEIEHFFAHYKELEPGKHSEVEGWHPRSEAEAVIEDAFQRAAGGHGS